MFIYNITTGRGNISVDTDFPRQSKDKSILQIANTFKMSNAFKLNEILYVKLP